MNVYRVYLRHKDKLMQHFHYEMLVVAESLGEAEKVIEDNKDWKYKLESIEILGEPYLQEASDDPR